MSQEDLDRAVRAEYERDQLKARVKELEGVVGHRVAILQALVHAKKMADCGSYCSSISSYISKALKACGELGS